jgi:hypothetical protein
MSSWGPNQACLISLCPGDIVSLLILFPCVLISYRRIIVLSLRLGNELRKLLLLYIALDFDQNVLKGQQEITATIGELQSLEHLATYGCPMYPVLIRLRNM